ncbi:MAG: hypothetical protein N2319_10070 [Candidatus Kapabacteria bacterium]|nr:hypothetical protein [Candidatus Kapabacteria bacterium]
MELDLVIKIAVIVTLLIFIVLSIYLIVTLGGTLKLLKESKSTIDNLANDLSSSLKSITADISELKVQMIQSLNNLDNVSKEVVDTTQRIEQEAKTVFNMFTPLNYLIKNFYDKVAPPVNFTASLISASSKAVATFVNLLGKKK